MNAGSKAQAHDSCSKCAGNCYRRSCEAGESSTQSLPFRTSASCWIRSAGWSLGRSLWRTWVLLRISCCLVRVSGLVRLSWSWGWRKGILRASDRWLFRLGAYESDLGCRLSLGSLHLCWLAELRFLPLERSAISLETSTFSWAELERQLKINRLPSRMHWSSLFLRFWSSSDTVPLHCDP